MFQTCSSIKLFILIMSGVGYNMVQDFLQTAKHSLWNIMDYESVTVVMGNDACDLDTVGSSLAYAIYYYDMYKRYSTHSVSITLFDILPDEIHLKTEVLYWMKHLKVPREHFMFRGELDLEQLHEAGKLRLILVDHHVLAPRWKHLESAVVEVVDHRPVQKGVNWHDAKVNIRKVGSCSSLIAEMMMEKRKEIFTLQISLLLYGPIVLDTAGLSPDSGRTESLDISMAVMFENMYSECVREKVLKELVEARADISKLTTGLVLIKDMKMARRIPICGFPVSIPKLMERTDLENALHNFCKERKFQLLVLMGQEVSSGNFVRDLGVFTADADSTDGEKLIQFLESSKEPDLQLQKLHEESNMIPGLLVYKQKNAFASRKQVYPIVEESTTKVPELQKFNEYPCCCSNKNSQETNKLN